MKNIVCFILVALLSACAPPLDSGPMRPTTALVQELSAPEGLQRNMRVENVVVPEEFTTSAVGSIDSATLQSILIDTLYSAGYLVNDKQYAADGSITPAVAKYTLDATLKELSTPAFGADLDAKCVIAYKLTRTEDGHIVWDESVTQGYLATFGHSFLAAERARIGRSKAVGENITQLLRILNRMELEEPKPARNSRNNRRDNS